MLPDCNVNRGTEFALRYFCHCRVKRKQQLSSKTTNFTFVAALPTFLNLSEHIFNYLQALFRSTKFFVNHFDKSNVMEVSSVSTI